jgi:hypothetical protein
MRSEPAYAPASRNALSSDAVIRAVLRYWEVAAVLAIAGTVAAWLFASAQPKRYRASSLAFVAAGPRAPMTAHEAFDGVDNLQRQLVLEALVALAPTDVIRRGTRAKADERIAAVLLEDTNLMRIDAEGTDPRRTALLANAAVTALDAQSRAMFRMYPVTLLSPASTPDQPALPRVERTVLAGLVLGMMSGAAAAWVLDGWMNRRMDRRMRIAQ